MKGARSNSTPPRSWMTARGRRQPRAVIQLRGGVELLRAPFIDVGGSGGHGDPSHIRKLANVTLPSGDGRGATSDPARGPDTGALGVVHARRLSAARVDGGALAGGRPDWQQAGSE